MPDYDEGIRINEPCPHCNSKNTEFEPIFGFWKCEDCSTVWGHDKDDPDYEDAENFALIAGNILGIFPRG